MIDKNKTISFFGAKFTWRRIVRIFSTFFLVILCSQISTLLNLKTTNQNQDILNENYQQMRFDYFEELESNLNEIFREFNYTTSELFANYIGDARTLSKEWYDFPSSDENLLPESRYCYNPIDELNHNFIRIGRKIKLNGEDVFIPDRYALNWTHVGIVKRFQSGEFEGEEYVSRSYITMNDFISGVYLNAHNRYLTKEELDLLWSEECTISKRFETSLKSAYNSKVEIDFIRAASVFNEFSNRYDLIDLFKAIVVPDVKYNSYKILIGHYNVDDCKVYNNIDQINAETTVFEETIEFDLSSNRGKILSTNNLFRYLYNKWMSFSRIFECLSNVAEILERTSTDVVVSQSSSDYISDQPFYSPDIRDPIGEINTVSYTSWNNGELAVAAVIDHVHQSDTYLDEILSESISQSVYGFLDLFSFQEISGHSWKDKLLDGENNALIQFYDVLFIDDYNIDNWDPAWDLTEKQSKVLAEWVTAGGSLYLSSATSDNPDNQLIIDKLYPTDWIELIATNVINGRDFNNVEQTWDIKTETPLANGISEPDKPFGEYAYNDYQIGLIPSALCIGVISKRDKSNYEWVEDSHSSSDNTVRIEQIITVPTQYFESFLSIDFKKLTSLISSELDIQIYDMDSNLIYRKIVSDYSNPVHSVWQTTGRVDITDEMRPYSGEQLMVRLIAKGDDSYIIRSDNDYYYYVHSEFNVDNFLMSFTGGKGALPILIYCDYELLDTIDSLENGDYINPTSNYRSYPYHSVDSFRSRYLADELEANLELAGYPLIYTVNSEELELFLQYDEKAIIIATHPFTSNLYNGTNTNPVIDWVNNKGGVFIDTQVEPLAYYIDENTLELVRVPNTDTAILGANIFKSVLDYDGEYCFALYSENFDDYTSSYSDGVNAFIQLENYLGGYLNISTPDTYYEEFINGNEIIIRDGINPSYDNLLLHFDAYLTDNLIITLSGKDQYDNTVKILCTLGEDIQWYKEEFANELIFYLSIPFNDYNSPSDLDKNFWNSILIDIDVIETIFGSEHLLYEINKLEFTTYGVHSCISNIWIGYSASTLQIPGGWNVKSLNPFVSDYPASLNILEAMRKDQQTYPGFDFAVFGVNDASRELYIRDDFNIESYPENDLWTEFPFTNWDFNDEDIVESSNEFTIGDYSLRWNKSISTISQIDLDLSNIDLSGFGAICFDIFSSEKMFPENWLGNPKLILEDINNEYLYFDLDMPYYEDTWTFSYHFFEDGEYSNFDFSSIKSISVMLPYYDTIDFTNYIIYLDNLHVESVFDDDQWYWDGLVQLIKDGVLLNANVENPSWLQSKELFGLGQFEFETKFSPDTKGNFGLFGTETQYGNAYFQYNGVEGEPWWNVNWLCRKRIEIEGKHTVSDFPVYLEIPREQDMLGSFEDFVFIMDNEKLHFEIVDITVNTISLWLNIHDYRFGINSIYLYYNNPAVLSYNNAYQVWDDYTSVYHYEDYELDQYERKIFEDSTGNSNNMISGYYDNTILYSGLLGRGLRFYGYDDFEIYPTSEEFNDISEYFSIEYWIRNPSPFMLDNSPFILMKPEWGPYYLQHGLEGYDVFGIHNTTFRYTNSNPAPATGIVTVEKQDFIFDDPYPYIHIASTYSYIEGTKIYINGLLVAEEPSIGRLLEEGDKDIERIYIVPWIYGVQFDELRFSNKAKSQSYFQETYELFTNNDERINYFNKEQIASGNYFYKFKVENWEKLDSSENKYSIISGINTIQVGTTNTGEEFYGLTIEENEGSEYNYAANALTEVDLTWWDGIDDIPISFRIRATAENDIANEFQVKFYTYDKTLIPFTNPSYTTDYYRENKDNKNGHIWSYDFGNKDSEWQTVTFNLLALDFTQFRHKKIYIAIGFSDSHTENYNQRVYLSQLYIGYPPDITDIINDGMSGTESLTPAQQISSITKLNSVIDDTLGLTPEVAPSDWWNEHWTYKREVKATNSIWFLTDYQLKVTLDNNVKDKCYQNGDDLRFVNEENGHFTEYSYWIEDWDSGVVWIKIPYIPHGANFYVFDIYYGNAGALSESNGYETFAFFDDFSGSSINEDIWTIYELAGYEYSYEVIDGELHVHSKSTGVSSGYVFETKEQFSLSDFHLHMESRFTGLDSNRGSGIFDGLLLKDGTGDYTGIGLRLWGDNYFAYNYYDDGAATAFDYDPDITSANTIFDYKKLGTNGDLEVTCTGCPTISKSPIMSNFDTDFTFKMMAYVDHWTNNVEVNTYFDIIYLRNYLAIEPTIFVQSEEDLLLPSANHWWDIDWDYRRQITPTGTSSGYGLQHRLILDSTIRSQCQENGGDLRFVSRQNPGKLLDFWIEDWTSGIVWVEQDYIPASGDKRFWMYYGNPNVEQAPYTSFETSFEEGPPLSNGWSNVEDLGGTEFLQDNTRKVSGSWSGSPTASSSYNDYRTDVWVATGEHTDCSVTGWVYGNYYYAVAYVYPIWKDWNNYVGIRFYRNYIRVYCRVNGVSTTSDTTIQSWNNKWWEYELNIESNQLTGWVKTGSTQYNLNPHSWTGTMLEGYVALRSRTGPLYDYWYDDIELIGTTSQSENNGYTTFPYFDDFNDNSINEEQWNLVGTGIREEVNQQLHIKTTTSWGAAGIQTTSAIDTDNTVIEYDVKILGTGSQAGEFIALDADGIYGQYMVFFDYPTNKLKLFSTYQDNWVQRWQSTTSFNLNTWYKLRLIDTGNSIAVSWLDESNTEIESSGSHNYDSVTGSIQLSEGTTNDETYRDNFKIRKYAGSEFTITIGDEESNEISPPSSLWTSDVGVFSFISHWSDVSDADEYNIYIDGEYFITTSDTFVPIDGLDPATSYQLNVASMKYGIESDLSTSIFETTYPIPITSINNADRGFQSLRIYWDAIMDYGHSGYFKVFVNGDFYDQTTDLSTLEMLITSLDPGTSYDFEVQVVLEESLGEKSSSESYLTRTTLDQVINLEINELTHNSIELSWQAHDPIPGYTIYYEIFFEGDTYRIDITSNNYYTVVGLDPETIYSFEVRATCDYTEGPLSVPIETTTLTLPAPELVYTLQAIVENGATKIVKEIYIQYGFNPTIPHVYKILWEDSTTIKFYIDDILVAEFNESECLLYSDSNNAYHQLGFELNDGEYVCNWLKMKQIVQPIFDGPFPESTQFTEYFVRGDIFVDPLTLKYGDGWLAFVKNTPVKPLTIDHQEESRTASDWIVHLIDAFFVNKIGNKLDFKWILPSTSEVTPPDTASTMSALSYDAKYYLNYPNSVDLYSTIKAGINRYTISKFQSLNGMSPQLDFLSAYQQTSPISDGYIRDWLINFYEDNGLIYNYPDSSIYGIREGELSPTSVLFRTTFDPDKWGHTFDWEGFYDSNYLDSPDYFGKVLDDRFELHSNDNWVLMLDEGTLTYDPGFDEAYEYSDEYTGLEYHFNLPAKINYDVTPTVEPEEGFTASGVPAPSAYHVGGIDTPPFGLRWILGTEIDGNTLDDLFYINDYYLDFDFWSNYGGAKINVKIFQDENFIEQNPLSVEELYDENEFVKIGQSNWILDYQILVPEENTKFVHTTFDISDLIEDYIVLGSGFYRAFIVIEVILEGGADHTAYIDNVRLTPESSYGANGLDSSYGFQLQGNFQSGLYFDPINDAKVVNYPYLYLEDIYSTDAAVNSEKDYELIYKIIDPINNYEILLHYCWSDDEILMNGQTNNDIIINGNQIDFYIQNNDAISEYPSIIQLDLIEGLNKLIQLTGMIIDREHCIHTLHLSISVGNKATNLQIGELVIGGFSPWKRLETDNVYPMYDYVIDLSYEFGEVIGKQEFIADAVSYIWSPKITKTIVNLITSNPSAVFINDQLVVQGSIGGVATFQLVEGINKITVRTQCDDDDTYIQLSLGKIVLEGEPSAPLQAIRSVDSSTQLNNYPMAKASLGLGSISFIGLDYEDCSLPLYGGIFDAVKKYNDITSWPYNYVEEPIFTFIKNILIKEVETRNFEYKETMDELLKLVEYTLSYKHEDRNYDWENKDDPWSDIGDEATENELEAMQLEISERKNLCIELYTRIMALSRTCNYQDGDDGVELTRMNNYISQMFRIARLDGSSQSWESSQLDWENNYWYGPDILDYGSAHYSEPQLPGFDRANVISTYCNDYLDPLVQTSQHFVMFQGNEDHFYWDDSVLIDIREHLYEIGNDPPLTNSFGKIWIYDSNFVVVDESIIDDVGETYYDQAFADIFTAFKALFQASYTLTNYESKTADENLFDFIRELFPDIDEESFLADFANQNIRNYINTQQYNLWEASVQSAIEFYRGLIPPEELEDIESFEDTSDESTNEELRINPEGPFPAIKEFKENLNSDWYSVAHYLAHNAVQQDYKYLGIAVGTPHYHNPYYIMSMLFGDEKSIKTESGYKTSHRPTSLAINIIEIMAALESCRNIAPKEGITIEFEGTKFGLVAVREGKDGTYDYYEAGNTPATRYGSVRWMIPSNDALQGLSATPIHMGIQKHITPILHWDPIVGATLWLETETIIDQVLFESSLNEILEATCGLDGDGFLEQHESPMFSEGTDYPLKLKQLSSYSEGSTTVNIKQLIIYEKDGYETETDITIREIVVDGQVISRTLESFREAQVTDYNGIKQFTRSDTVRSIECITLSFDAGVTGDDLLNPENAPEELLAFAQRIVNERNGLKITDNAELLNQLDFITFAGTEDGLPSGKKVHQFFHKSARAIYAQNTRMQIMSRRLDNNKMKNYIDDMPKPTPETLVDKCVSPTMPGVSITEAIRDNGAIDPNNRGLATVTMYPIESLIDRFISLIHVARRVQGEADRAYGNVIGLLGIPKAVDILTTIDEIDTLPKISPIDAWKIGIEEQFSENSYGNGVTRFYDKKGIKQICVSAVGLVFQSQIFSTDLSTGLIDLLGWHKYGLTQQSQNKNWLINYANVALSWKTICHISAMKLFVDPTINVNKRLPSFLSKLYTVLTTKQFNANIPILDDMQLKWITGFDIWRLHPNNAFNIYDIQGRKNYFDIYNGRFSPFAYLTKMPTFAYQLLDPKTWTDVFQYIIDEELVPIICKAVLPVLVDKNGDYVPGARLINEAQSAGIRYALRDLSDLLGTLMATDTPLSPILNQLIESSKLKNLIADLVDINSHTDIYKKIPLKFSPQIPSQNDLTVNTDGLAFYELYPEYCVNAEILPQQATRRSSSQAGVRIPSVDNLHKLLGTRFLLQPVYHDGIGNPISDVCIGNLLYDNVVRIERSVTGDIAKIYKDITYFDTTTNSWQTLTVEINPDDPVVEIGPGTSWVNPNSDPAFYSAANSEDAKNLPLAKMIIFRGLNNNPQSKCIFLHAVESDLKIIKGKMQTGGTNYEDIECMTLAESELTSLDIETIMSKYNLALYGGISIDDVCNFRTEIIDTTRTLQRIQNTKIFNAITPEKSTLQTLPGDTQVRNLLPLVGSSIEKAMPLSFGFWYYGDLLRETQNFMLAKSLQRSDKIAQLVDRLMVDGDIDYKYLRNLNAFINHDLFAETNARILMLEKDGFSELTNACPTDRQESQTSMQSLTMRFLGTNTKKEFVGQQMVGLLQNIKTQLWQMKVIEMFSISSYLQTYARNIQSMDPGSDNVFGTTDDISEGKFTERYKDDFAKYSEGIFTAALVWLTDYIELGPLDIFEYINGMISGAQLAKIELGMAAIEWQTLETIVEGLTGLVNSMGVSLPAIENFMLKISKSWPFKAMWFVYLYQLGSKISIISQLISTKSSKFSVLVQGLCSTGISMISSRCVNKIWSEVSTVNARYVWQSSASNHWSNFAEGDMHMAFKIAAYRVSSWLYASGQGFRPDNSFCRVFYLSSYFPNFGAWYGPFDSLLPFVVLSSAYVGLLIQAVGLLIMGSSAVIPLFGAAVCVVFMIAYAFMCVILQVLKRVGLLDRILALFNGDSL